MAEQEIEEVPGASQFMKEVKKNKSIAVCFATGSLRRPAIQKLKAIGVDFDNRILVASDRLMKRESIVKQAIADAKKFYNVEGFERIISIGDGLWDLKTAQNLELEFVGIGLKNKEVLLENGCLKWFEDFEGTSLEMLIN
jgi:phosphoglycolate phosphatase-like HAD superfamily hydrolase